MEKGRPEKPQDIGSHHVSRKLHAYRTACWVPEGKHVATLLGIVVRKGPPLTGGGGGGSGGFRRSLARSIENAVKYGEKSKIEYLKIYDVKRAKGGKGRGQFYTKGSITTVKRATKSIWAEDTRVQQSTAGRRIVARRGRESAAVTRKERDEDSGRWRGCQSTGRGRTVRKRRVGGGDSLPCIP